jgi:DNA polymerase-4
VRIAFVSIPRFPCAVEVQRSPALAHKPLIIGDADQPKRVLECSHAARLVGVRPGVAIRKALGLCPQAAVLPPDPVLYRSRWEATLNALDDISPEVEDEEMGRAYLNASGLQSIHKDDATLCRHIVDTVQTASGLRAGVGLAEGKFPAFAAAAQVSPGGFRGLLPGQEAGFLAPLDIDLLPVGPEVTERLEMLGFESIGEVAALTLPELQSQFGKQGERLWQLANGIDNEPLYARRHREIVEAALSFEAPVAGIDVLIAAAKQLLSRLRLPLRGRAVRELTLQAELISGRGWERRLVFREAVSENDRLVFLLRSTLTNFPPPQAVRSFCLRMSGLAGETGKQLSLGERGRLQKQLEEAIRQLRARYGHSPIYYCVDVEPWSVIPEDRQILVESDV